MLCHKGYTPSHVAEIGVYHPETSNIIDYINNGTRATLVEPDPESIRLIHKEFSNKENVTHYPYAIYKKSGKLKLSRRGASTFVTDLSESPAIINDEYVKTDEDTFLVDAVTFDEIDDGTIDLISVDIEGAEWYVIENMVSRPDIISLETHGAIYINPHINEIEKWLADNNYRIWYMDESDSVYIKNEIVDIGLLDKLSLFIKRILLAIKRSRKRIKRKIKNLVAG